MILVTKTPAAPARLSAGDILSNQNCAAFEANPGAYRTRAAKFQFDSAIFGHTSVRKALESAQHAKCCYCEGRFRGNAPGDVEHFRPKSCVQQAPGSPLEYPAYYWLAYSWPNLYYSCPNCNRMAKKNLFPLLDPSVRARGPANDLSAERPLLLDPGGLDDPRDHIKFRREVPVGITQRGRKNDRDSQTG